MIINSIAVAIYNAYDIITPVLSLFIIKLILHSPFSNPNGPRYSIDPLSITLVV
jgi:hypothetical protein